MIRFASAPIDSVSAPAVSSETSPDGPANELDGGRVGLARSTVGDEQLDSGGRSRADTTSRARRRRPTDDPRRGGVDDEVNEVNDLEALGEQIATLAAHIHAATHQLLLLIAEFDRRRGWQSDGHSSCAHWLAFRTGIELVTAREKVRVARALRDLPQLNKAMSRGELSFAKVRALTRAATASNEGELLAFARDTTAAQLERTVRSIKLLSRQDEVERERERHRWRAFSVFPDGTGMYEVRGRLDPEVAAVLMRAVEAASDAMYATTCEVEEVEPQQRRADAMGLVAERALAAGFSEVTAVAESARHAGRSEGRYTRRREDRHACRSKSDDGCRPEDGHARRSQNEHARREDPFTEAFAGIAAAPSVPKIGFDEAAAGSRGVTRAAAESRRESHAMPRTATDGVLETVRAKAPAVRATGRVRASQNVSAEVRDPATAPETAGVLSGAAESCDRATGNVSAGHEHSSAEELHATPSGSRAERYQVVVHVDPDTLRSGIESGRSELADGTRLSPETARRLSCDTGVVRVTRSGDGSILDVGRRTRTISPALRRALEVRDGGCRFPGCGSRFVEAHHVVHWADGGQTSLANCCLVCRRHHRLVHEEGYRIDFPPGGAPTFYTPRGLPVPDTPPRLPRATLDALLPANLRRGISPDGWTCTAHYEREAEIPWPVLAKVLDAIDP